MVLKIIRLLITFLLLTEIHIKTLFDYRIVYKNNLSDRIIQLVINIQNNDKQDINPGTIYNISINEYEGKFVIAKTIRKGCYGKGIIYIYGNLSEKRFKDIYDSNLKELNFSMKENNKDNSLSFH